jgi:aspartate-semialdehyde dehydrogenase
VSTGAARMSGEATAAGARIGVAVLGATGAVGQMFVRLLAEHPWFEVTHVAASARSVGKTYAEATHWLAGEMPRRVGAMTVVPCEAEHVPAPIIFSALDSAIAVDLEAEFARAGRFVFSNARSFRMEPDVPLLIPEVNADHAGLVKRQQNGRWDGMIVTNPNCAAVAVAMALAPLHQKVGVRQCFVTTLQAVSGAGYPGVPSLDILGNVIPFIGGGEEEKIESETKKMLGTFSGGEVRPASIAISAQATRVPVEHGHLVTLAVSLEKPMEPLEAAALLDGWRGQVAEFGLPSAPARPLVVMRDESRPQPRRDVSAGGGMTVSVGRMRRDPVLDLRFVALTHNLIRGAAGGSVLNAELIARLMKLR